MYVLALWAVVRLGEGGFVDCDEAGGRGGGSLWTVVRLGEGEAKASSSLYYIFMDRAVRN